MKLFIILSLLLSFSAQAQLDIPSSVDIGEISWQSEITGEILIDNNTLGPASVDIGTLQGNYFKFKSTTCSCSLLRNRFCKIIVGLPRQGRQPVDYVLTDTINVNGQSVTVSATVKGLVHQVDDTQFFLAESTAPSIPLTVLNFGSINSSTTVIYKLSNLTSSEQNLELVLPIGVTLDVANTTCPIGTAPFLRNRVCDLALRIEPIVCAGSVYNEEFKIFARGTNGGDFKLVLPVTADFSGATSPACLP